MEEVEQIDILLVEDNPLDAELATHGLKDATIVTKVIWLKDGEQALDYLFHRGEYAGRGGANPRLILLDLKMPKVDGIEALKVIKADEKTRRIPVVMMTSSQEESDIAKSYDLGANSYVVKPIDFNELSSVAQQAGVYWLAINRGAHA